MEQQVLYLPNLYSSIRLEGIQYGKVGSGWSYPTHRHTNYEFLYCVQGGMEQWLNGRAFSLYPGDAMVIKPGMYHHSEKVCEDTVFFDFHFDIEMQGVHSIFQMADDTVIRAGNWQGEESRIERWTQGFIAEFGDDLQEHDAGIYDAGLQTRLQDSVRMLRMQSQVLELISLLAEELLRRQEGDSSDANASSIHPSQLKIAYEAAYLMETSVAEGIRMGQLAERLKLHRSYVNQIFRRVFGMSPRDYWGRIRIREAKRLLQETDLSVEDICHRLAFSSPGHFSRFFRSIIGLSPLQYRNKLRQ